MNRYVCLLRGINVSGKNVIKMKPLCAAFEALGFATVQSYVQSGNLLFDAIGSPAALARKIGKKILDEFGCEVSVLVLGAYELRAIASANPFLKEKAIDPSKLHVTFLAAPPDRAAEKRLAAVPTGGDRFHLFGGALYLHCPSGYGKTKLSNAAFERALGTTATTRNWKTVTTLVALADAGRGSRFR